MNSNIYWERQSGDLCRLHSINAYFGFKKLDQIAFFNYCREYDEIIKGLKTEGMDGFSEGRCIISHILDTLDSKYVFLTNSGTTGLHLSLLAVGASKNNDVILPSYLCEEVLNAVKYTQANPKFVDINSTNYSIDLLKVKKSITKKTCAITVPYQYGDLVDIEILVIANFLFASSSAFFAANFNGGFFDKSPILVDSSNITSISAVVAVDMYVSFCRIIASSMRWYIFAAFPSASAI